MAYYYLAAQLPSLRYGEAAPMSSAAFRELARTSLESADAVWLDACAFGGAGAAAGASPAAGAVAATGAAVGAEQSDMPEFFRRWKEWEEVLRLNLARARAAKARRELALTVPDYPADAAAAAKTAAAMDSPLEAEIFLDQARWKALEEFQGIDYFSRNTIYAYLLKLLLLERRACFKLEEGRAQYKGLYASVMEAAGSGFHGAQGASSGEPK
jgi:hypothetical protein